MPPFLMLALTGFRKNNNNISFLKQNKRERNPKSSLSESLDRGNPTCTVRVYSSKRPLQNKLGLERWRSKGRQRQCSLKLITLAPRHLAELIKGLAASRRHIHRLLIRSTAELSNLLDLVTDACRL